MEINKILGNSERKRSENLMAVLEEHGYEVHLETIDRYDYIFARNKQEFGNTTFVFQTDFTAIGMCIEDPVNLDDENKKISSMRRYYREEFYLLLGEGTIGIFAGQTTSVQHRGLLGLEMFVKDGEDILEFHVFSAGEDYDRAELQNSGIWRKEEQEWVRTGFNSEVIIYPAGAFNSSKFLLGGILYQVNPGEDYRRIPYVYVGNISEEYKISQYPNNVLLCEHFVINTEGSGMRDSTLYRGRLLISGSEIQGGKTIEI